ncbi:hypothetical protein AMECASPLE_010076 [Ameca splendens]|uniref:Uncharacterized protein n=1 Tax=Ameca splendens TaxID=208324 RepID=A0ABV0ZWB0_9TELE
MRPSYWPGGQDPVPPPLSVKTKQTAAPNVDRSKRSPPSQTGFLTAGLVADLKQTVYATTVMQPSRSKPGFCLYSTFGSEAITTFLACSSLSVQHFPSFYPQWLCPLNKYQDT